MSYCRWSCLDYECDLYVYAHYEGGYVIHVARNRLVVDATKPKRWTAPIGSDPEGFVKHYRQLSNWMKTCDRMAIGLPEDGKSFWVETAQECADECKRLRSLGYIVPDYAIEELEEEARENGA